MYLQAGCDMSLRPSLGMIDDVKEKCCDFKAGGEEGAYCGGRNFRY